MKNILITTIAAVLLVGCGKSQQSAPAPEATPVEPVAEVPAQPSSPPPEAKQIESVVEAAKPTAPPKVVSANKGADPARGVKAEPPTAKTPDISIHNAAKYGLIEAVKKHLAAGTDVNAKHSSGLTPLDEAIRLKRTETADLLRKHGGISGAADSIHVAATVGNIEAVRKHLAAGTDVNAKDKYGSTPLHWATREGHKEIAELLIEKGADVNAKNVNGFMPLDLAIKFKQTKTADLLRKHGGKTGEELKAEGK
jgi:ankyrin repeat protein